MQMFEKGILKVIYFSTIYSRFAQKYALEMSLLMRQFCRDIVGNGENASAYFLSPRVEELLLQLLEHFEQIILHMDATFKVVSRAGEAHQLLVIILLYFANTCLS